MFVRVKDLSTGHEFDLPETHPWLTSGLVKRVKPRLFPPSSVARPPKHNITTTALQEGAPEKEIDQ